MTPPEEDRPPQAPPSETLGDGDAEQTVSAAKGAWKVSLPPAGGHAIRPRTLSPNETLAGRFRIVPLGEAAKRVKEAEDHFLTGSPQRAIELLRDSNTPRELGEAETDATAEQLRVRAAPAEAGQYAVPFHDGLKRELVPVRGLHNVAEVWQLMRPPQQALELQ